ncbi:MAG: 30S ribosomal protein S8 [Candidatus Levybacteria bacterium RIFCSPLOWO2_01_FULL_36_13]|nr:MAG: 30S ribosomal protein S8 [Candidatus Levybacteria bacterium RIFCSPHIGHO2_01_FULL_36_15b]OGH35027.1 MAG: 30S ribosomal protein S8 [Candidatus Levybacteria bacterium RIFCSPLOWO2_01_FULL_36_13]
MNHLVSDFVIRIKNSAIAKRKEVILPHSKINKEIGKVLVREGFLEDLKEEGEKGKKSLRATIKYENRIPVLTDIEVISKPSLRVYGNIKKINEIKKRGRRRVIVSTSKGLMTSEEAQKKGVGGEILFAIW